MNVAIIWMIIGMGIVTYVPRLLPLITLQTDNWPKWSKRMLGRVPYAVLGALIFPGVLTANENIWFALFGGMIAVMLAFFSLPLIFVVGGAIGALALITYLF
ncbi:AzlD domain-containing protein [Evansella sp. AB-rgal1]|uniref:AzlD domain-containing protein n=1 Tax=Evansella sp. AB-rgal1 TaxID=3242696 RepID=UPI00359D0207